MYVVDVKTLRWYDRCLDECLPLRCLSLFWRCSGWWECCLVEDFPSFSADKLSRKTSIHSSSWPCRILREKMGGKSLLRILRKGPNINVARAFGKSEHVELYLTPYQLTEWCVWFTSFVNFWWYEFIRCKYMIFMSRVNVVFSPHNEYLKKNRRHT